MARKLLKGRDAAFSVPAVNSALSDIQGLNEVMAEARMQIQGSVLAKRPPGSFSVYEFASMIDRSPKTAASQLLGLVARGGWERVRAYHPGTDGRLIVTFFYRKKAD